MRRWLAALLVVAAFGGLVSVTAIATLLGGLTTSPGPGVPCGPVLTAADPRSEPQVAVGVGNLNQEQRRIVELIISVGQERGLPPRAWQVAIQAGMTESRLRNLNYGDRDSLGIFQMRPSQGWGTVAQVTDPVYQVNKFYDVLLTVPDWETRRPGDSAQAVERSAFPDRYHQWESLAVELIDSYGGDVEEFTERFCPEEELPAVPQSEAAQQAIAFALGEVGKPYVWGGTGPDVYDCSGLMLRAYESAGVTLPRVSRQQYWAGSHVPLTDAQPGDLLFWGYNTADPDTIHHVAMYLGNGQMVEAANPSVPLRQRAVSFDEDGLMPLVVRPGVSTTQV